VLDIPRYGCLNIHASLLPRWRGAAPIQRAIQAGDAETGITIMQMDVGLDTGDMLLMQTSPITATDNAATLHDKLAEQGAGSIVEALRLLQAQQLQPIKQVDAEASYATKLLKTEAQIDWRQDAKIIERAVRAFNPFPVCQSSLHGVIVKVWQARLIDAQGVPGTVLAVNKQGVTVACGKGALCLEVLQRPGSKAQPAAQFLQAMPIVVGECFP
jgi:methionyl-tRNA formyltransferase